MRMSDVCLAGVPKVFKVQLRAAQAPKGAQFYSVHHLIPAGEGKGGAGPGSNQGFCKHVPILTWSLDFGQNCSLKAF